MLTAELFEKVNFSYIFNIPDCLIELHHDLHMCTPQSINTLLCLNNFQTLVLSVSDAIQYNVSQYCFGNIKYINF